MPDRDAARVLDTLLEAGITGAIPATDANMAPTLRDGDCVVVTPFLGLPRPGQVVMARIGTTTLIRRVIDIRMRSGRRRYRLRGDSEPGRGIDLPRENLFGRITVVLRLGRRVSIDDVAGPGARSLSSIRDRGRRRPGRSPRRVTVRRRRSR